MFPATCVADDSNELWPEGSGGGVIMQLVDKLRSEEEHHRAELKRLVEREMELLSSLFDGRYKPPHPTPRLWPGCLCPTSYDAALKRFHCSASVCLGSSLIYIHFERNIFLLMPRSVR